MRVKVSNGIILGTVYCALVWLAAGLLGLYKLDSISYFESYDTMSYLQAKDLLFGHGVFHSTRCFAYPMLLQGAEWIFGSGKFFLFAMYVIQLLMLLWVVQWHYRVLALRIKPLYSLGLSLLLMLNVTFIVFAFSLLTEISCLFFLTLSFEQFRLASAHQGAKQLFLSFFFLCIAVLLKPGLLLFLGVLLVVHILNMIKKDSFKRQIWPVTLAIVFTLGIQVAGMYQHYRTFRLSYIGDITMYRYMNTSVLAHENHEDILSLMSTRDTLLLPLNLDHEQTKQYNAFSAKVKKERNQLIQHSSQAFIQSYFLNLFSNFHTGNTLIRDIPTELAQSEWIKTKFFDWTRIWNMIFISFLLLSALVIWVQIATTVIRTRKWQVRDQFAFLLLSFSVFAFLISGVSFYQGDRFNVIWMPFLIPALVYWFVPKKKNTTLGD